MNVNTADWDRHGRGRSFDFYATSDELEEVMASKLPSPFSPYSVIACRLERGASGEYTHRMEPVELKGWRDKLDRGVNRFFLRSHALTSAVEIHEDSYIGDLNYLGLIILHHGHREGDSLSPSNVGIVNRIVHLESGEVVEHKDYDKIYRSMVRSLKKLLAVETTWTRPDGEVVTKGAPRMTRAMAELVKQGAVKTVHQPLE